MLNTRRILLMLIVSSFTLGCIPACGPSRATSDLGFPYYAEVIFIIDEQALYANELTLGDINSHLERALGQDYIDLSHLLDTRVLARATLKELGHFDVKLKKR